MELAKAEPSISVLTDIAARKPNSICNLGTEQGNRCAHLGSALTLSLSVCSAISSLRHPRALKVIEKWEIAFFSPAPT